MASIRKRKYTNGIRWEARVRRPPNPTLSKTFSLKADAEAWASDIERKIERGDVSPTDKSNQTVAEIIKRYLAEVTPLKRGRDVEAIRLRKFMESDLGSIPINALNAQHLISHRDRRLSEVSGGTVKKELVLLGHVVEIAIKEWGVRLESNPVRMVKKPPENRQRDRRLEAGEKERLLRSTHKSKNILFSPIVELALETGMRRGEILGLKWVDIKLQTQVAHLPLTKNGSSRTVPLSKRATEVLGSLTATGTGRVFPIHKQALRGLWLRACKRANIENLHFHDLRHEATSKFFEKGLNVMEVAAITGHKDLRMLQRYTHLRAEDLAKKLG